MAPDGIVEPVDIDIGVFTFTKYDQMLFILRAHFCD